jgi:hypothetical protein
LQGPNEPSRLRHWAWLCAIALHLALIVVLRVALREPHHAVADADVVQVDLLAEPSSSSEPTLPEPEHRPARVPRPPPSQRPAVSTPFETTAPAPGAIEEAPQLRLFNPDGGALLPDDIAEQLDRARPQPNFIARTYEPSPILEAKRPIKVRPNHFDQYWVGTEGMPLHEALLQRLIVEKEFTAPWGGKYGCVWVLIIVTCADVPDKPWNPPTTWKPATVFDER